MSDIPFGPETGMIRLALTAVLLGVVIFLSYLKKIGIGREVAVATVRGFCQLMLLAMVFAFIFEAPEWWLMIWALFAVMVAMAGYTSSGRVPEISKAWEITTPSITAGAVMSLSIMALTGIMPLLPQFVIPLAGMAFGNSMNVSSLTLNRIVAEVRNNRARIEAALALGATAGQAAESYLRASVRAGLISNIDSLKTLGIIFIPGTMAGLLMAGASPVLAAEFQIMVYFMILGAGIVTALLASHFSVKRLFTEAHQLVEMEIMK